MTSIVIPLGNGSRWNDTELRYCLRSITKHLTGYGNIFIIGEKPEWLRNIVHIPCPDYSDKTYHKERNIFEKIMAACRDERVTDDFLFMNDDHYMLQNFEAEQFPYYCQGWLSEFMTVTDYKYTVSNTLDLYREINDVYFDIHCPLIYNKKMFVDILNPLDWSKNFGYCIKSVYCNNVNELRAIEYPDLKINEVYSSDQIRKLIAGRPWFSIGDKAREGGLLRVLNELYPNKSIYEK